MGTGSHFGVSKLGSRTSIVGNLTAFGIGVTGGIGCIATLTTVVSHISIF